MRSIRNSLLILPLCFSLLSLLLTVVLQAVLRSVYGSHVRVHYCDWDERYDEEFDAAAAPHRFALYAHVRPDALRMHVHVAAYLGSNSSGGHEHGHGHERSEAETHVSNLLSHVAHRTTRSTVVPDVASGAVTAVAAAVVDEVVGVHVSGSRVRFTRNGVVGPWLACA